MRNKITIVGLLAFAVLVATDADAIGRRRQNRQSQQNYSQPQQSPCPGGVCPSPNMQAAPSQPGSAPMGYTHLNPPQYAQRPVAPAPTVVIGGQDVPLAQPATPVAPQPARPAQPLHAVHPAPPIAAPDPRLTALLDLLETMGQQIATLPPEPQPEPEQPPAPPMPPQTPMTPPPSEPPSSTAGKLVEKIGVVEITYRDGDGKEVSRAEIDLSEFVRKEVGSK